VAKRKKVKRHLHMSHESGVSRRIADEARQLGFDLVGITPPVPPTTIERYQVWLASGFHGEMAYLARPDATAKRADLSLIQPGLRSVVTVGANYHTVALPPGVRDDPSRGIFASYAWGDEYHEWFLSRLHRLAAFIQDICGEPVAYRAYVDTGPILEREIAVSGGLGFVGKNTNLIHPELGSWLFLGELFLAVELPATQPGADRGTCGGCTRCLDACPTGALTAPYVLDARRCISYLTIELTGIIPRELRPLVGNRIFGCDICQEVCPWNRRFARPALEPAFQPRPDALAPRLLELLALGASDFRQRFRDSPVKRAKRRGLLRNVVVALGNWGDRSTVAPLARAIGDDEPLVRGHAAWALGRIACSQAQSALAQALTAETDPWVQEEIRLGLQT
jgi:epoxyqueuosine reductase